MLRFYKTNVSVLYYILVLAAAVRIMLPIVAYTQNKDISIFYSQDSAKYVSLAKELLENKRFAIEGLPEIERTPGYPIFLIPGILFNQLEITTTILQTLLSCLSIYLVYKISLIIFKKEGAAIFSATLYAFEPLSILYASKILTETLFTTLLLLHTYFFVKYLNETNSKYLAGSIVFLATATYTKPISIYLIIPLSIILFFYLFCSKEKSISKLFVPFLFIVIFITIVYPWQIRNYMLAGYNGFSAIQDRTLYSLNTKFSISKPNNFDYHNTTLKLITNNIRNRANIYKKMKDKAIKTILHDPTIYILDHARGLSMLILNPGMTEYLRMLGFHYKDARELMDQYFSLGVTGILYKMFKEKSVIFLIMVLANLLLLTYYFLCLISLVSHKRFSITVITITTVIIYLLVVSSYAVGISRYRQPIMPLVSIFSGGGLLTLINKFRRK